MDKTKKPFYKKWWFITIVALIVVGLIFAPSEEGPASEDVAPKTEPDVTAPAAEDVDQEAEEVPEEVETDRKKDIENAVKTIVEEDLKRTSISQLTINENAAKDNGSYIVLPHLVWDVKNGAEKTREMLETYSDHLAAKLAEQSDVDEITIFWEAPYHLEGNNVAKYMYERSGDGMAKTDKWLDPLIQ